MSSNHRDYYEVLGVSRDADLGTIKRAYRRLALELHPDRNPDDAGAEERFKQITLAYGVLSDPERRRAYDRVAAGGFDSDSNRPGRGVDPDAVFRDLFASRDFQELFERLMREYQRQGWRTDRGFLRQLLGPGAVLLFGGLIIGGPLLHGRVALLARALRLGRQLFAGAKLLRRVRNTGTTGAAPEDEPSITPGPPQLYHLPLDSKTLRKGGSIALRLSPLGGSLQRVTLNIPPNTRVGQRFRLPTSDHEAEVMVEVVRA